MPLYDIECTKCKREREIFCCIKDLKATIIATRCTTCKAPMKQIIRNGKAGDWFRSFVSEDFNGSPIEVTSKKHLKKLCKQHGVTSKALL